MLNRHKAYKRSILCYILENRLKPGMRLPTVKELSEILDLSKRSVEEGIRQLRNEGYVEAKRKKGIVVRGFRPPMAYRKAHIGLVTVWPPSALTNSPYPSEVIDALSDAVAREGAALEVCTLEHLDRRTTSNATALREIEEYGFDCLFLFELESDSLIFELRNLGIPTVSIDADASHLGIPSVAFDNTHGTLAMTEHLLSAGHRRIAYFRPLLLVGGGGGNTGTNAYVDGIERLRYEGYRLAMLRAGLRPCLEECTGPDMYRDKLQKCLDGDEPVSAIVTGGDSKAESVARAALKMGLKIPDDISLSGFGDTSREFSPGRVISSVHVDSASMGREAARLMKSVFDGQIDQAERVLIPAEVAEHDSTAAYSK